MKVPFRLEVLKRLTAALEEITPANGFQHDLTGKVWRGRNKVSANAPYPLITILEDGQQPDLSTGPERFDPSPVRSQSWSLLIKGDVADDKQHPTDLAHYLMADVKKRLMQVARERTGNAAIGGSCNILQMHGLVSKLHISPGIVRPSEENISPSSFFWLVVTLEIVEDMEEPFKITR